MAKKPKRGPVPQTAIDFLEGKDIEPGFSYTDVWREEHNTAFTVAKVMESNILADVQDSLTKALQDGETFRTWSTGIKDTLDKSGWTAYGTDRERPRRLLTIYDTNVRQARAVGQWERIDRTKATRPFLVYALGPSERHRPWHESWEGTVLPIDDPWWSDHMPINGWLCFLPGTKISGEIVGAAKSLYDGEAVEIKTGRGARLTVTKNHPIMTPAGFVAAGDLKVGDQCFHNSRDHELSRRGAVGQDQIPTVVEDVFATLVDSFGSVRAVPSVLDFHGEAASFEGEVEVVGTYVQLIDRRVAPKRQRFADRSLALADHALVLVARLRDFLQRLKGSLFTPGSFPGGLTLAPSLRGRSSGPFEARSFGPITNRYTPIDQMFLEGGATDPMDTRQLLDAGTRSVRLDQVVSVRRFPYVGHVYDLQSKSGWLWSDSTGSSNCKCHVFQQSQREIDRRGGVTETPPNPDVDWKNPRTGKTEKVPRGIDPGFNYNPGKMKQRQAALARAEKDATKGQKDSRKGLDRELDK